MFNEYLAIIDTRAQMNFFEFTKKLEIKASYVSQLLQVTLNARIMDVSKFLQLLLSYNVDLTLLMPWFCPGP